MRLIAHMLGLPESDGDLYRKWIKMILEDGITDVSVAVAGRRRDARTTSWATCTSALEKPGDDLISYLLNGVEVQRPAADAGERDRLAAAAADRRHRHHLERHRLVHLASGHDTPRTAAGWSRSPR